MTCPCERGGGPAQAGFREREDGVWVHLVCNLPTLRYLTQDDPDDAVKEALAMLNLFRFGTHHNELVETKDLLRDARYGWIGAYAWTPEIVYGSESGRAARVWVAKDSQSAA